MSLLKAHWKPDAPVRSLTIAAQQLVPNSAAQEQLSFWSLDSACDDRYERLETAIDGLRDRYGSCCIRRGCAPLEMEKEKPLPPRG